MPQIYSLKESQNVKAVHTTTQSEGQPQSFLLNHNISTKYDVQPQSLLATTPLMRSTTNLSTPPPKSEGQLRSILPNNSHQKCLRNHKILIWSTTKLTAKPAIPNPTKLPRQPRKFQCQPQTFLLNHNSNPNTISTKI